MTGFIKGLFGKKQQEDTQAPPMNGSGGQGSYFLDPDDAKTFGDIDYMRTSKTVKRTFAKGGPRVRQISATTDEDVNGMSSSPMSSSNGAEAATPQPRSQASSSSFSSSQPFSAQSQRKAADSSMDMFRNMAKEIRKR